MHVITRKRLNEFALKHPDTQSALDRWYDLMNANQFASFVELRDKFPSVDQAGNLFVFNIGGNKVRLIAGLRFQRGNHSGTVYIRAVLTHDEYDEDKWKE